MRFLSRVQCKRRSHSHCLFFFNDTATTEIYTLSLHDALPIWWTWPRAAPTEPRTSGATTFPIRSEEHTSELQSPCNLVCRLLLEKNIILFIILYISATVWFYYFTIISMIHY